ncbi:hypothetical protein RHGRI_031156 [Rhododendron griersonianum]|uniref:Replication factor-A protein 1 N-terminal domain-containing protein n=1 Tax=Rhododendron griersonianum TaxID=479676 RepID=A0AAV6I6W9_9ERIC|nr:hypothetical protein RHGRI_031156 [Rhododendron griersonianum]
MAVNLTAGAIAMLSSGDAVAADVKPVLQVADVKLVNTKSIGNERYRILLSDGVHLHQGMLVTKKNDLVRSQRLQKGSIVQLSQFVCNVLEGRSQTEVSSHLIHRDQPEGDFPSGQPAISVGKPNVIGGRYKANAPNAHLLGGGISQSPSSSYGGTPHAAYRQPPPMLMYPNRGPVAENEVPPRNIPIAALKFVIKSLTRLHFLRRAT